MQVYLIPVGCERYELYCETTPESSPETAAVESPVPRGFFRRVADRFRAVLAHVEHERRRPVDHGEHLSRTARVRRRVVCWLAEAIAEQRLLWNLRNESAVEARYPADMDAAKALEVIQQGLRADAKRHLIWLVIDLIGFGVSGVLVPIPGPNLLAYYFAFRLFGHYLSMRGARHGLSVVQWRLGPCALLAELRRTLTLTPPERRGRVAEVAAALGLEDLPAFFERTALPTA
jgi:hypothetical protein